LSCSPEFRVDIFVVKGSTVVGETGVVAVDLEIKSAGAAKMIGLGRFLAAFTAAMSMVAVIDFLVFNDAESQSIGELDRSEVRLGSIIIGAE
jgi:hypothetical protein